jgi:adenosylcobyric acid synthase
MKRVHGGNFRALQSQSSAPTGSLVDYSASINPLGPPAWYRQLINRTLAMTVHYPDPMSLDFRRAAADAHYVQPNQIVPGNGVSELIFVLPRLFGTRRAIMSVPSYGDYRYACEAADIAVETFCLKSEDDFQVDFDVVTALLEAGDGLETMVWLGQPNNPTAITFDTDRFSNVCRLFEDATFVVDESFADFIEGYTSVISLKLPNVIVLRSLTKFYGVPGLRIGYSVSSEASAEAIKAALPTWSVNTLAQAFAVKALCDNEYAERTRSFVASERRRLATRLTKIPGLVVFESEVNFLLFRLVGESSADFSQKLLDAGFAVRTCEDFDGLGNGYFRIAIRSEKENDELCDAISGVLAAGQLVRRGGRQVGAARLMLQGTASNVGKSVLSSAVCRILLQDGLRVAPFKAQNMSLNSFVTADGGEMGRAQVVQAQACRIDPDVRMNPVLLKPSSDTGSQVILCGKPIAFMEAKKYHTDKTSLFKEVKRCFDELAEEYDVVVIEGAGSPGEVNLKQYDIVNMRMAEYAQAPVLLVGDIDRGGVFASFIGTMDVLDDWERELVKGFLINKFRGDAGLLGDAVSYTFDYTGKPTLGIIPMIRNLGVPDEDSVSFKEQRAGTDQQSREDSVTIALIDVPHISNFTDFDPFENEPDVCVKTIRSAGEIDGCDAIVIPGSKNIFADLRYLKESGIASRITHAAKVTECPIVGVCGGYQMLGRTLSDPLGIESNAGPQTGLGLLAVDTVLGRGKILEQTAARHVSTGLDLKGYEIHHGRTVLDGPKPWIERVDGEIIGVSHPSLEIYGTYMHGVFDADRFRRHFIDRLRARKGLEPLNEVVYVHDIEPALDRLAEVVRSSIDMDHLYQIMGI